MLGGQAAARGHHGVEGLGMMQGMGLGMMQRWLGMRVLRLGWVLELKLGFELLLVHTGWPIMRKRLFIFFLLCLKKLLLYLLEQTDFFTVLQKSRWRWSLVCKSCIRLDGGKLEGHLMLVSVDDQMLL